MVLENIIFACIVCSSLSLTISLVMVALRLHRLKTLGKGSGAIQFITATNWTILFRLFGNSYTRLDDPWLNRSVSVARASFVCFIIFVGAMLFRDIQGSA